MALRQEKDDQKRRDSEKSRWMCIGYGVSVERRKRRKGGGRTRKLCFPPSLHHFSSPHCCSLHPIPSYPIRRLPAAFFSSDSFFLNRFPSSSRLTVVRLPNYHPFVRDAHILRLLQVVPLVRQPVQFPLPLPHHQKPPPRPPAPAPSPLPRSHDT
jgi:hypothetical protein